MQIRVTHDKNSSTLTSSFVVGKLALPVLFWAVVIEIESTSASVEMKLGRTRVVLSLSCIVLSYLYNDEYIVI